MSTVNSQEIDIIKLYAGQIKGFENNEAWNIWLSDCRNKQKIDELVRVRTGLQLGMANCEKRKMSNESIVNTYCRWIGSIEKTIRGIVSDRQDLKGDHVAKKQRDSDIEVFLRKSSY